MTLEPAQRQQFTATLTNLVDTSVTWSLDPAVGSISNTGLYTAPASVSAQQIVTVTAKSVASSGLTASARVTLTPDQVRISAGGIAHGASTQSVAQSGVSPGLILVIYGANMGPGTLVESAADGSGVFPNTLAGTRVWFDNIPAPLLYTSAGQVSVVAPYAIAGRQSTQVQVEYQRVRSGTVSLPVTPSAPGLFTVDKSGLRQGAILNQDSSYNSADNPAARGDIVMLYGSGEGLTTPPAVDGRIVGLPPPALRLSASATVGGLAAEVVYAGPAPGLIAGMLQMNVRIPNNAPTGDVPVAVRIGGAVSRDGVTVALK